MKARIRQPRAAAASASIQVKGARTISVLGARANNLRRVDCTVERGTMVCVCGVSGSGKSSLLFSVLAAEIEARHETLLANPRRKSETARAPADAISGLPFGVTVSQRVLHAQKRSTVATQTGIQHDLISLVRDGGRIRCACGAEIGPPSAADLLTAMCYARQRTVQTSIVIFRQGVGGTVAGAGCHTGQVLKQQEEGGAWRLVPPRGSLAEIEAYAVRWGECESAADLERVLAAAIAAAGVLLQSKGKGAAWALDTSCEWPCGKCGAVHPRATNSLLSFNSAPGRSGRCQACIGAGTTLDVNRDRLVADPGRPVLEGALALERRADSFRHLALREDTVRGVIRSMGATEALPWRRLPEGVRDALLLGTGRREQPLNAAGKKTGAKVLYHGFIPSLTRLAGKVGEAGDYARTFAAERPCPQCAGRRYDAERVARYEFGGRGFLSWLDLPAREFRNSLQGLLDHSERGSDKRAALSPCLRKLEALDRAGLGHLVLGRGTATLSGGELQRLKISRSLVGGLTNACFILDEPSLGLHAADNEGMLRNLCDLRDAGNTVILADHDPDFIAAADTRIFLGPGAGHHGGRILTRDVSATEPARPTGKVAFAAQNLVVSGCSLHNVRNQTISIPLGGLVCLTGVSGSGKSTFANGILVPALKAALAHGRRSGPAWADICGIDPVSAVLAVEQAALSRSRRSLVATYAGLAEPIRGLLAATEPARQREYRPAMFSSNRAEGWCLACRGLGILGEDDTDASTAPLCDSCRGARFRDAILDCSWRGKSIADILDMELADAAELFTGEAEIARRLTILCQLGLGHLKLGRATSSLSGGEAQRLKLASGIAESRGGSPAGVFFVLDEPTAGLHRRDVQTLLNLLDELLAGGRNTVVVIEHDLSVIRASDHVVDFGPGSADAGGRVVAQGPPSKIAATDESKTGEALRRSPGKLKARGRSRPASSGVDLDSTVPTAEEAERFSEFLQQHYRDEPPNECGVGMTPPAVARPTYLMGDTTFPPRRATVLEALRFTMHLDELLQPSLRFQPESNDIVWVSEETIAAAALRYCRLDARVAWSPVCDLASEGRATRSALPSLLRNAGESGARIWIDETGVERSLEDADFRNSDPFHVRVVLEGDADAATCRRALQLGSGWACVLTRTDERERRWKVAAHLVNRPLSISRRAVAGRTLRTGLSSKGGCPFCAGVGELPKCDEALVCAAPTRSPVDAAFFTPGARALLEPVAARLKKTLEFFQREGVADLLSPRERWNVRDRQLLWHGYPWARFPIPGRAQQKGVDYYEWRGLLPLIIDRLHLSKDQRWRVAVESGSYPQQCEFCSGSGLGWSAQHTTLDSEPLPDVLRSATLASLSQALLNRAPPRHALRACLEDACRLGLGAIRLQQTCAELSPAERRGVRILALRHVGFDEAGYLLPEGDRGTLTLPQPGMRVAFSPKAS
ncbi:MAG TPA: hypothetical protein VF614_17160 [Chthoniobacteraceae bacterium]